MLMHNSSLKAVTTTAPNSDDAYFVYEQRKNNAWLLLEDTAAHGNAIDVVIQVWGELPGKDADEAATWWIIDEFTIAVAGPVGQFLSYPLSFKHIYVQELAGGTTHVNCKLVSDLGGGGQ